MTLSTARFNRGCACVAPLALIQCMHQDLCTACPDAECSLNSLCVGCLGPTGTTAFCCSSPGGSSSSMIRSGSGETSWAGCTGGTSSTGETSTAPSFGLTPPRAARGGLAYRSNRLLCAPSAWSHWFCHFGTSVLACS